ncbi:MAG TPA: hypothetical protein VFI65_10690 [Streptosporangiaceae bacterium]|nr:hypothetical protein [Streptosporangiaceae bacterium]
MPDKLMFEIRPSWELVLTVAASPGRLSGLPDETDDRRLRPGGRIYALATPDGPSVDTTS